MEQISLRDSAGASVADTEQADPSCANPRSDPLLIRQTGTAAENHKQSFGPVTSYLGIAFDQRGPLHQIMSPEDRVLPILSMHRYHCSLQAALPCFPLIVLKQIELQRNICFPCKSDRGKV